MEVFIDNIAHEATQIDIVEAIARVLHSPPVHLGGPLANFRVHLFTRQNKLKSRGPPSIKLCHVIIADIGAARRLLDHYGHPRVGPTVLRRPLRLKKSNRGAPNAELVQLIRTTPFEDPLVERERRSKLAELATPIKVASVEFGRLEAVGGKDVFSPEVEFEWPLGALTIDGQTRSLVLHSSSRSPDGRTIAVHIHSIVSAGVLSTKPPSLLLVLSTPPTFEASVGDNTSLPQSDDLSDAFHQIYLNDSYWGPPRRTRVEGFGVEFQRVAPFVGRHIRIVFPSNGQIDELRFRKTLVRLPKILPSKVTVEKRQLYSPTALEGLQSFTEKLDVRAAFQIQRALSNGILSAFQLNDQALKIEIGRLLGVHGPVLAERILHRFVSHQLDSREEQWTYDEGYGDPDYFDEDDETRRPVRPFAELAREASRAAKALPASSPVELVAQLKKASEHIEPARKSKRFVPDQASVCRHVVLTPSGVRLEGPFPDHSNATLRRYGRPEHFLRVSIREENLEKHRHDSKIDMNERYLPFFVDGLSLCGRTFRFLGYSQSALRDHSAWFVADFAHEGKVVTAASIRQALGDFSNVIHIPARYIARVAQAFTATQPSITLQASQVHQIPDVDRIDPTTGRATCFTDGVGTISQVLAAEVDAALVAVLKNPRRRVRPTCWQIHIGGAKGMIVVDPTLAGKVLCLRPTMQKFDAPDSLTLDIALAFDHPLPAYLNRPLIKILEDLGVPAEAMLKLQRNAVGTVEASTRSVRGAALLLEQTGLGASAHLVATLYRIRRILGVDVAPSELDPFLAACVDLAVTDALRGLKFRARIPLPGSFTLVGVADEDGCLEEGEVFACVKRAGQEDLYLEGLITISRSPTIHPGDVQIVRAVGRLPTGRAPRTSQLSNCVVFSVKGNRSLPECLGGGDLDGDLYMLITDPNLLPMKVDRPAAYEAPKMNRLDRKCTIEDGAKFFLDHILSDLMGVVATRHLHLADVKVAGTRDPNCILLAKLHSAAVDFPKTGVPVSFTSLPYPPPLRPDFMLPEYLARKKGVDYYPSPKVLGQLFRAIPLDTTLPRLPPNAPIDPSRILTDALARLAVKGLPSSRLGPPARDRIREIVESEVMFSFGDELLYYARINTLSQRADRHLSEAETFVGTISAPSKDDRRRRDGIARLQDQTASLFGMLRDDIVGYEETPLEEQALWAWASWHAALEADPSDFGARSYGWVALGALLEVVEQLNEEE